MTGLKTPLTKGEREPSMKAIFGGVLSANADAHCEAAAFSASDRTARAFFVIQ